MTNYLSVTDVSKRFGVCTTTIWRWTKHNPDFPNPIKFGPKTTRWSRESIDDYESELLSAA